MGWRCPSRRHHHGQLLAGRDRAYDSSATVVSSFWKNPCTPWAHAELRQPSPPSHSTTFTQHNCHCASAFIILGKKLRLVCVCVCVCVCWTPLHQQATHSPRDNFNSHSVKSGRHRGDNVSSLQRTLKVRDRCLSHLRQEPGAPPWTKGLKPTLQLSDRYTVSQRGRSFLQLWTIQALTEVPVACG
jgi:hypothetical protein